MLLGSVDFIALSSQTSGRTSIFWQIYEVWSIHSGLAQDILSERKLLRPSAAH